MNIKPLKYCFFLVLSCIVFLGCGKEEPLQPIYKPDDGELVYEVKGFREVALERVGEAKLQLNVERLSGSKTTEVILGASDLPDGLEVQFDVQKSSTPYVAFAKFIGTRVKEGTYNINITASGVGAKFQRYPMTVKILPYTNEANGMKGDYTESHNCVSDGQRSFKVAIQADRDTPNRVILEGLWSGAHVNEIYGYLDAATHSITIPPQVFYNITYKGTGTYTDDQILIDYTVKSDIIKDSCTAVLDRVK